MIAIISKAQNLVPNPSFESYTLCPTNSCDIEAYATFWNAASTISSTDYFNTCSPSCKLPTQFARTGNGYSGFFFLGASTSVPDQREYLQVKLTNPLIQNSSYYVEFFVVLRNISTISACNNVTANFSVTRPYTTTAFSMQPLAAHIMNPGNPIINDKVNWVQISGCYTAQGGEEYLTIGNFMDDAHTQTTGTTTSSYYLVDDVRVEEIPSACVTGVNELASNYYIKIYPNPNNGTFSIAYTFNQTIHTFELYDLMDKKINEKALNGNDGVESINLNNINSGIYFYKVVDAHNGMLASGKLVISK